MAQTIWIHKLTDSQRPEAEGMDYICQHLSQALRKPASSPRPRDGIPSRTPPPKMAPPIAHCSAIPAQRTTTTAT